MSKFILIFFAAAEMLFFFVSAHTPEENEDGISTFLAENEDKFLFLVFSSHSLL